MAGFITAFDPVYGDRAGAADARVVIANTSLRNTDEDSLVQRYAAADDVTVFGVDKMSGNPLLVPRIFNHSYGDDDAYLLLGGGAWMRAIDFRSKYLIQTEIIACGNHGNVTPNRPNGGSVACRSFNSINVGGFDDRESMLWSDHKYYERYGGPFPIVESTGAWFNNFGAASDREQPEVAAAAVLLKSTEQSDGFAPESDRYRVGPQSHTGTSYAAPQIAGVTALVHHLDDSIKWTPIAMKALLLATSIHPINGDAPPDFGPTKIGGMYTADLRVGSGAIYGPGIRDVLDSSNGRIQIMDVVNQFWSPSSAGGWRSLQQPSFRRQIQTDKQFVRVALSWYADSPCRMCLSSSVGTLNDETWFGEYWGLPTDLDVEVSDANGNVVSRSVSFDNNYEILQFPTSGLAQPFNIRVMAFEGGVIKNETIALAWYAWDQPNP